MMRFISFGKGWVRVFGYGVRFVDHRVTPPQFSERMGFKKTLHVGPYCFMYLPRPRTMQGCGEAGGV
jgi:hypothetical protein